VKEEELEGPLGGLKYPSLPPLSPLTPLPPSPSPVLSRRSLSYHPATPTFRSPSYHPEHWVPPRSPTPVDTNELDYRYWSLRTIREEAARIQSRREEIYALHYVWRGILETITEIGESAGNLFPGHIIEY
jgi:hypothetical protein